MPASILSHTIAESEGVYRDTSLPCALSLGQHQAVLSTLKKHEPHPRTHALPHQDTMLRLVRPQTAKTGKRTSNSIVVVSKHELSRACSTSTSSASARPLQ